MSRSVLVTGASKGIGRAIACQLAADGFIVGVRRGRAGDAEEPPRRRGSRPDIEF